MDENMQSRAGVLDLIRHKRARLTKPIPISDSRLFRQRRESEAATRASRDRPRRDEEAALLQQKRALADQMFDLCERASEAARKRGGEVADDLERIAELSFLVSYWDSETAPEADAGSPVRRLEESRDFLAAMALASDVAQLAAAPPHGRRGASAREGSPSGPRTE
jgi:hypothetical protein